MIVASRNLGEADGYEYLMPLCLLLKGCWYSRGEYAS